MPAARYWRIVGIETYTGGDLELSEIALCASGSRIDGSAVLACSHVPIAGALAALKDGSLSTACRFASAGVRSSGFHLTWDFGTPVEIDEIKLGSSGSDAQFLRSATLVQATGAGDWSYVADFSGAIYPGAMTYTTSSNANVVRWSEVDRHPQLLLSNGNLTAQSAGGGVYHSARANQVLQTGAWYWELLIVEGNLSNNVLGFGVANANAGLGGSLSTWLGSGPGAIVYFQSDGFTYSNGIQRAGGQGDRAVTGDVIRLGVDVANNQFVVYKNNSLLHSVTGHLPPGPLFPAITAYGGGVATANFGAQPFEFPVLPGFEPLPQTNFRWPLMAGFAALAAAARVRIAASAPVGPLSLPEPVRALNARDVEYGGPGTVYGTTKTKGTPNLPTKARVVLLHQRSKLPVRETWSDPVTGYFEFRGIDTNQQFLTLAEDAEGHFRPVAANRLTPEVA